MTEFVREAKKGEPFGSGGVSISQLMVHWACRCKGNVDAFMVRMLRHNKENPGNSLYLSNKPR